MTNSENDQLPELISELLDGPTDQQLSNQDLAYLKAYLKQPLSISKIQREKRNLGYSPYQRNLNKLKLIRDYNQELLEAKKDVELSNDEKVLQPPFKGRLTIDSEKGRIQRETKSHVRQEGVAIKVTSGKDECSHSEDFTSVIWYGKMYEFTPGNQAESIKVLWKEWEKGRHSLSETTIGEKIVSSSDKFRLDIVFRGHPAWGTMIQKVNKGVFRLGKPNISQK